MSKRRFMNALDPELKEKKWTVSEEEELFRLQKEHGNRWAELTRIINGRSENTIKNHFYVGIRKSLVYHLHTLDLQSLTPVVQTMKPVVLSLLLEENYKAMPPELDGVLPIASESPSELRIKDFTTESHKYLFKFFLPKEKLEEIILAHTSSESMNTNQVPRQGRKTVKRKLSSDSESLSEIQKVKKLEKSAERALNKDGVQFQARRSLRILKRTTASVSLEKFAIEEDEEEEESEGNLKKRPPSRKLSPENPCKSKTSTSEPEKAPQPLPLNDGFPKPQLQDSIQQNQFFAAPRPQMNQMYPSGPSPFNQFAPEPFGYQYPFIPQQSPMFQQPYFPYGYPNNSVPRFMPQRPYMMPDSFVPGFGTMPDLRYFYQRPDQSYNRLR